MNNSPVVFQSSGQPVNGVELLYNTKTSGSNNAFSFQTEFESQFQQNDFMVSQQTAHFTTTSAAEQPSSDRYSLLDSRSERSQPTAAKPAFRATEAPAKNVKPDTDKQEKQTEPNTVEADQNTKEEVQEADYEKTEQAAQEPAADNTDNETEASADRDTAAASDQQASEESGKGNNRQSAADSSDQAAQNQPARTAQQTAQQNQPAAQSQALKADTATTTAPEPTYRTETTHSEQSTETTPVAEQTAQHQQLPDQPSVPKAAPAENQVQPASTAPNSSEVQPATPSMEQAATTTQQQATAAAGTTLNDVATAADSDTTQAQLSTQVADGQAPSDQPAVTQQTPQTAAETAPTEHSLQEQAAETAKPTKQPSPRAQQQTATADHDLEEAEQTMPADSDSAATRKADQRHDKPQVQVNPESPAQTAKQTNPTRSQTAEQNEPAPQNEQTASKQSAHQPARKAGFEELQTEADIKVKSMQVEMQQPKPESKESAHDLLRSLAARSSKNITDRPFSSGQNYQNSNFEQSSEQQTQQQLNEFLQNQKQSNLLNSMFAKSKQVVNGQKVAVKGQAGRQHAAEQLAETPAFSRAHQQSAAANLKMAQMPFASNSNLSNVVLIQELMGRIQSMIRNTAGNAGSKLSMDFTSNSLGQMNLELQQKESGLVINLEVGNESSKQQLMDQRDELAAQLRQMGYKNVDVNVSNGNAKNDQNQEQQQAQYFEGNSNADNVRLAGSDAEDLAQILANNLSL